MITTSNFPPILASARLSAYSRPARINSIASAPARSMLAGSSVIPSEVSTNAASGSTSPSSTSWIDTAKLVGILAERKRQTPLRIEVDEQHSSALLHHRRPQRRDRRRFGDPTLLIGDRKYPRHVVHRCTRADTRPRGVRQNRRGEGPSEVGPSAASAAPAASWRDRVVPKRQAHQQHRPGPDRDRRESRPKPPPTTLA